MIRRKVGSDWQLIAQADHARLAAELASHIGNHLFEQPAQRELFVRAVAVHDDGWINIDGEISRDDNGESTDFTGIPLRIALAACNASAERAVALDPLIGLLVSLHGLALSVERSASDSSALADAASRFGLNKFQHRQIELQERCRKQLGLAADEPLHHGLAESSTDPREQVIVQQFRLLQAMDQLSLSLCCARLPASQLKPVLARAGGRSITLRVRRDNDHSLRVSPWPMDSEELVVSVPAMRIPVAQGPETSRQFHANESIEFRLSASR